MLYDVNWRLIMSMNVYQWWLMFQNPKKQCRMGALFAKPVVFRICVPSKTITSSSSLTSPMYWGKYKLKSNLVLTRTRVFLQYVCMHVICTHMYRRTTVRQWKSKRRGQATQCTRWDFSLDIIQQHVFICIQTTL